MIYVRILPPWQLGYLPNDATHPEQRVPRFPVQTKGRPALPFGEEKKQVAENESPDGAITRSRSEATSAWRARLESKV